MRPAQSVVRAFGLSGEPRPAAQGQGGTFLLNDGVLRRVDDVAEAGWIAAVMSGIVEDGFRVPRPIAANDRWVLDGWTAWTIATGQHRLSNVDWPAAVAVALAFSRALSTVPRPALLDRRSHVFAVADRVAWGEGAAPAPVAAAVERIRAFMGAVHAPHQLVHGDMSGNLLWAGGLPPAVIDLSPYWRPAGYAAAVVVVDAVLWHGAGVEVIDLLAAVPEADQLIARALAFRLIIDGLLRSDARADLARAEPLIRSLGAP